MTSEFAALIAMHSALPLPSRQPVKGVVTVWPPVPIAMSTEQLA